MDSGVQVTVKGHYSVKMSTVRNCYLKVLSTRTNSFMKKDYTHVSLVGALLWKRRVGVCVL